MDHIETKPEPVAPPTTQHDPNMVMLSTMAQTLVQALTEPERIKAEAEVKKTTMLVGLGRTSIIIAASLIAAFLVSALTVAVTKGETGLLGQVISGGFGFLAGIGFSRFLPQKQ